ncbi:hypothetical protein U1Q18_003474 [Sarracenia purpurea var. burkii]
MSWLHKLSIQSHRGATRCRSPSSPGTIDTIAIHQCLVQCHVPLFSLINDQCRCIKPKPRKRQWTTDHKADSEFAIPVD